jgi:GNAT superfamily N-acetyltransferase
MSSAKHRIRPARPADHGAFAQLVPELAVDDPIPDPARFALEWVPNTLIAEGAEAPHPVLGYTMFQVIKAIAYVRHIVTAPEARRTGVGRALMEAVAERARTAACTTWCLNVKPNNAAAIALYEGLGLAHAFASRALLMAWSLIEAAPRQLHDARVSARLIHPDDDARVEAATRLISGQLAMARRRPDRVLLAGYEGAEIVGATIFDPTFPGAYPFRAARPELAFTLLRALRPYARPSDATVNVVTEDQPDVADALIAAGATVKLDIMHMSGPLPAS